MGTHIFLIDDDIDEMKTFVEALKESIGKFKCTYASNGVHAMKMLTYLKPEIIFIDYHMPAMDGLQVVEEIRKKDELKDVPLFLYSVPANHDLREKAYELGVTECMDKPCSLEKLVTMLKAIFRYS